MVQNEIANEYFEWMYHLVCNGKKYSTVSYRKLLILLNDIEFYPRLEMDENIRVNAIDFRRRFAYENGYSDDTVEKELAYKHCGVLEVMVSLAFKIEESIMANSEYGNRTGQWFWDMIVSLELGCMDDSKFDERYVFYMINNFLNGYYEPNGRGSLFTLTNPKKDLRDVDIWTQCMWYLNECS